MSSSHSNRTHRTSNALQYEPLESTAVTRARRSRGSSRRRGAASRRPSRTYPFEELVAHVAVLLEPDVLLKGHAWTRRGAHVHGHATRRTTLTTTGRRRLRAAHPGRARRPSVHGEPRRLQAVRAGARAGAGRREVAGRRRAGADGPGVRRAFGPVVGEAITRPRTCCILPPVVSESV